MASDTMIQQPSFGYTSYKKGTTGPAHSYEFEMGISPESFAPVFQFRRRLGEINWRKIAMIDVEKIARELDIDMLQENIQTVTFCNIDIIADLDPMFAKLFKLAQFMIEYMLHSQASLQAIIAELEGKLEVAATQQNSAQDHIKQLEGDIDKLKSENKKRRKMIEQQQMLIESGASSYYKCPHCEKAFVNASFLQGHMQRKHPGSVNYIGDVIAHSQREQSRLAGKLEGLDADLQRERTNFNEKLKKAEEEKAAWGARTRRDMDRWKKQEEGKWRKELETMKKSFIDEITQLRAQETEYKQKITKLETSMERHSNLGELVDDIEGDKQKLTQRIRSLEETNQAKDAKLRQLSNEMANLKEQSRYALESHKKQMSNTYNSEMKALKNKLKEQGKRKIEKNVTHSPPIPEPEFESEEDIDGMTIDERLSEIRKQKPAFVKRIRPLLQQMVSSKLQDCGVDPDAPGINSKTLTNKLMVRKTERQRIAKKQPGYYSIRDQLRKRVEEEANRRNRGSPTRKKRGQTPSKLPKQRPSSTRSGERSPVRRTHPAGTLGHAPLPVNEEALKAKRDKPMTRDELNTRYGDDDSLWDSEPSDENPGISNAARDQNRPRQRGHRTPVTTPKTMTQQTTPLDRDDDSWNSDDVEDLLSPETDIRGTKSESGQTKVQKIGANIESKLQNRNLKKRPVGAVDVMPASSTPVQIPNAESDDDFSQISSLQDQNESPKPAPRISPTKVVHSTNTMSSGGTSVWGSGHGKPHASGKNDDAELSDWDDDISEL